MVDYYSDLITVELITFLVQQLLCRSAVGFVSQLLSHSKTSPMVQLYQSNSHYLLWLQMYQSNIDGKEKDHPAECSRNEKLYKGLCKLRERTAL